MDKETPSIPLVLVDGFLSATSAMFWGKFEHFLSPAAGHTGARRPIFFTSVGPVSSLHDRACELYYELKGGRVDYGEEHAKRFGHERYGREHDTGLYPAWSVSHPLHLLAHSLGGSTIIKLVALLRDGFFGEDAHPDMVLSVTTVSSPLRGTQLVYVLGERADAAPAVRTFSIGSLISRSVHFLAYLAPLFPRLPFDLHADARRLAYHQSPFRAFLRQLWHSDWAEGCDAAPYDCTFAAADRREARAEGIPNMRTWYRSYACVFRDGLVNASSLSSFFSPFYLPARLTASFDFSSLRPRPSWFPTNSHLVPSEDLEKGGYKKDTLDAEYTSNDGIVPLFSQWHPFPCSAGFCLHDEELDKSAEPGLWYVRHVPGVAHHLTLVPVWLGTQRQREFWTEVGLWLKKVEGAWGEMSL